MLWAVARFKNARILGLATARPVAPSAVTSPSVTHRSWTLAGASAGAAKAPAAPVRPSTARASARPPAVHIRAGARPLLAAPSSIRALLAAHLMRPEMIADRVCCERHVRRREIPAHRARLGRDRRAHRGASPR